MSDHDAVYEGQFTQNLRRYAALRSQIKRVWFEYLAIHMRALSF